MSSAFGNSVCALIRFWLCVFVLRRYSFRLLALIYVPSVRCFVGFWFSVAPDLNLPSVVSWTKFYSYTSCTWWKGLRDFLFEMWLLDISWKITRSNLFCWILALTICSFYIKVQV
ncbi:hypothetical protein HYC85_008324 [Camellia sinensis]|uniref:Uncharacterized protein n=1 Tax=Camellia sinensis TaxID=4442 RepID=A0A7J7HTX3_CAMSI|nr:hypothetical protein HYC85_008324 [Camellia sinensis]